MHAYLCLYAIHKKLAAKGKKGNRCSRKLADALLLLSASVHVRVKSINMKGKQTGSQASAHFWTLHKQAGTKNGPKQSKPPKKRNSNCSLQAKNFPRRVYTF